MRIRSLAPSIVTVLAVLALGTATGRAQEMAGQGVYVRADAGAAFAASNSGDIFNGTGFGGNFGTSSVFDAGAGVVFGSSSNVSFRAEGLFSYRGNFGNTHSAVNPANSVTLATKSDIRNWTLVGNGFVDFAAGSLRPYVGGGLGVGHNELKALTYTFNGATSATEPGTSKSRFAWALMAGVGYALGERTMLDVGYRYLDAGNVASSGSITINANNITYTQPPLVSKLHAHELTAGIRYSF